MFTLRLTFTFVFRRWASTGDAANAATMTSATGRRRKCLALMTHLLSGLPPPGFSSASTIWCASDGGEKANVASSNDGARFHVSTDVYWGRASSSVVVTISLRGSGY